MENKSATLKIKWYMSGLGILLLMVVVLVGRYLWIKTDQNLKEEFLRDTQRISQAINLQELKALKGVSADEGLPEYQRLKQQLILTKQVIQESRFLYIMGKNQDESIFFYIDSELAGSADESPPGQIYENSSEALNSVFTIGTSQVEGELEDQWGNWISALVPLLDPQSGQVMALLGIDIDAAQWNQIILRKLTFPFLVILILAVVIFISILFFLNESKIPLHFQKTWLFQHTELIALIIIGFMVTAFFTWDTVENKKLSRQLAFENLAESYGGYITNYLHDLEYYHLSGLANFFDASEYVSQEEFNIYTAGIAKDPKILAWEWVPEVPSEELQTFMTEARTEISSNYQVWELNENGERISVKDREQYFPVYYMNPSEGLELALGFDIGSESNRRNALETARESGLITASDPLTLVTEKEDQVGVLVVKPVFDVQGQPSQNGFLMAVLRMGNLLDRALGFLDQEEEMVYIDLFQLNENIYPTFLAGNSPLKYREAHTRSILHDHPYTNITLYQPIYVYGKVYSMIIHPGERFLAMYRLESGWFSAILGAFFTILFAGFIHLLVSRDRSLERLVQDRTAELQNSEHKYRNLAESTSAVLWEYDIQNDRWTYIAPQVTDMTGWQPQDFSNLQFWVEHLYQDDQEWAPAYWADFTKRGEDHEFEYRFLKPDGSYLWIRDVVSVEVENGKPLFLRGYMIDITQRKEDEERLQTQSKALKLQSAALFSSANAIVITDIAGVIEWANPAFHQLTGYSISDAINRNPRELINSGVQGQDFYQDMWNTILSGKAWQGEIINRKKDGSLYSEEMTITPVKDKNNEISHFIAIKQDISQRKQHEVEMVAIATISSSLRTANSRAELIPIILEQVLKLFQADGAALVMRDVSTGESVVEAANGVFDGKLLKSLPEDKSISGIVYRSGKPFVTDNVSKEAGIVWSEAYEIAKAIVCVPLFVDNQAIGNLRIGRTYEFLQGEVRLLSSIADIVANAIHRETLRGESIRQMERLSTLRSIDQVLTNIVDLRVVLNFILEQVTTHLKIDAAVIHLYNPASHRLQYADGHGFLTQEIEKTNIAIGEHYLGLVALEKKTLCLPKITDDEFPCSPIIAKERFVSYFATPIIAKGQVKGVMELFHRTHFNPDGEWINYLETIAGQTAIAIDNSQLFEGLQRSNFDLSLAYDATIEGWSRAMDLRDRETEGHTKRVTELTLHLARMAGFTDEDIVQIRRGALLHDMGKLGIPDSILHKPGALTDEEWILMKKHPIFAYEMLSPISYLKQSMDIPYCHHEKWDGSGYPRALKGEEIPLAARIFAVVDVYDALTSNRPYRSAWSKEKALDFIEENSGKHFDPMVVRQFFELIHSEPEWLPE